jgi:hypothetical protein
VFHLTASQPDKKPLIRYVGLSSEPFNALPYELTKRQPPKYATEGGARSDSASTAQLVFKYQRKTEEMNSQTEKMLQDAVDTANSISSRIVSNLRQRKLLRQAGGSGSGDGRVFMTLEQQAIPSDMLRKPAIVKRDKKSTKASPKDSL